MAHGNYRPSSPAKSRFNAPFIIPLQARQACCLQAIPRFIGTSGNPDSKPSSAPPPASTEAPHRIADTPLLPSRKPLAAAQTAPADPPRSDNHAALSRPIESTSSARVESPSPVPPPALS